MLMNINYQYPPKKLYVLIKPFYEIMNKKVFEPEIDVKLVSGLYHITYAYGSDWIWNESDEYHIGFQLEPCYWGKDYEHILVHERTNGYNEDFYKEFIEVLKKPD